MARIRSVKPEYWTSEQVMECSPTARLLLLYVAAIGVLAQCTGFNDWIDPHGQGEGDE